VQAPDFNRFAESDIVSLLNPLAQGYLNTREGTSPNLQSSIAALRLTHDLRHPNTGSIYPTSRSEALGHFAVGALYPRRADQAAITRSLERENQNNPIAMIPTELKQFKKATGQDVPQELVTAYQADLAALQQEKEFKNSYASDHGSSGFRSLPPQNQAEAAYKYLTEHHLISPQDSQAIQQALSQMTTDEQYKNLANALWSATGTGHVKRTWDQMMATSKSGSLTRKR
jgi:hypothetical protein